MCGAGGACGLGGIGAGGCGAGGYGSSERLFGAENGHPKRGHGWEAGDVQKKDRRRGAKCVGVNMTGEARVGRVSPPAGLEACPPTKIAPPTKISPRKMGGHPGAKNAEKWVDAGWTKGLGCVPA